MTQTVLLGDLLTDLAMGPFGSNLKVDNFIDSGVPVIKGGNLYGYEVSGDFSFVSEEKAQSLKRSLAYPDDIVITHRGTLGQVSIVPHGKYPYYLASQSQLRMTPNKNKINPRYLLYYLRSSIGQRELMQHAAQVGVPSIATPTKAVKSLKILLPDLLTQAKIADILGTIDEKIELNRKMNEALEQMGQALFRHYFIDNPETDRWDRKPLSEQVDILSGGTPKTSESLYWGGNIPWFSVVDAPSSSDLFTINTSKYITEEGLKNSAAKIIPEYTTIISARGTVGKLAIAGKEMTINQSCYALKSKTPFYTYLVINACLTGIKARVHGSVFDTITRNTFDQLNFIVPPFVVLDRFENEVKPLFLQVLNNVEQTQTLTALRDTLLPRLINGKISLKS